MTSSQNADAILMLDDEFDIMSIFTCLTMKFRQTLRGTPTFSITYIGYRQNTSDPTVHTLF